MKKMAEILTWYGYQYDNWKEYADISQEIEKYIVGESFNPHARFFSKALAYIESVQVPSLSLFIGLFIAGSFSRRQQVSYIFVYLQTYMKKGKNIKPWRKLGLVKKKWLQAQQFRNSSNGDFVLSTLPTCCY